MEIIIDNKTYKVDVIRKNNKNTYIRVDSNLNIVVTTNIFVSNRQIMKLIDSNINSIRKMIEQQLSRIDYNSKTYYLGKCYDLVRINDNKVILGDEKIFIGKSIDYDKWLKNQAKNIFKERLDYNYNIFSKTIPYPSLLIRKMTTRWGVCNYKDNKVTLNLELIKKDTKYLDYVIIHELSHFIYHDHSKNFWSLVEENCPDYKNLRKRMKEY